MRRLVRIGIVLAILWVAYLAWPFFALYGLVDAVESRNARAVVERVNFSAVRLSFSEQIFRTYLRLSGREARLTRLQDMIVSATAAVVDPIVSELMTTDALFELLYTGWPRGVLSEQGPGTAGLRAASLGSVWQLFVSSSHSLRTFSVSVPSNLPADQQFRVVFRLSKWRWRLSAIELPDELRVRIAQELIKRIDKR